MLVKAASRVLGKAARSVMAVLVTAIHVAPLGRRVEITHRRSTAGTTFCVKYGNGLPSTTTWMAVTERGVRARM